MKKKVLSTIIALIMVFGTNVKNISADELIGLSTNPPFSVENSEVSTYSNTIPSATWNLSNSGYNVSGVAYGQANLYTNYLFTGVDSIAISISNKHSNSLTVKLYKRNTYTSSYVGSFTVYANSISSKSFNVDKNSKYYFSFSSPSNFSGYIA